MITNKRWLELRDVDITPYIKQKQGMDFISWGDCELLMRLHMTDDELVPWESWLSDNTVFVKFEGYPIYSLAVSDFRNQAIENPDCTDIEDTRQRAFVKAVARCFGLGHKLYEQSYHASKGTSRVSNTPYKPSASPRKLTRSKPF